MQMVFAHSDRVTKGLFIALTLSKPDHLELDKPIPKLQRNCQFSLCLLLKANFYLINSQIPLSLQRVAKKANNLCRKTPNFEFDNSLPVFLYGRVF